MSQFDRTVIELVESAARTMRTTPLVLGGQGGAGGGEGVPPGGVVGQLAQYRVAYDTTEAATLATLPSGVAGISGWSLVDNLNHIRYRLGTLESGGSLIITDDNTSTEYLDTTNLHFIGSGIVVTDLGSGDVQVEISATNDLVHYYNDDLTSQVPSTVFTTSHIYASGTLRVYYNGIRQRKGIHYVDDASFTTFSTYFTTYSGDSVVVDYDYLVSAQTSTFTLTDSNGTLVTDSNGNELTESL